MSRNPAVIVFAFLLHMSFVYLFVSLLPLPSLLSYFNIYSAHLLLQSLKVMINDGTLVRCGVCIALNLINSAGEMK